MTRAISRYSHLVLAFSAAAFVFMASVTGIILAFEPIIQSSQPYAVANLKKVTLAKTLSALKKTYDEALTLKVDADGFVTVEGITKAGTFENNYIHPMTGEKLGTPTETHPIFSFTRNLHRSLFLKTIGRFFVGLMSFLMFLIAVTGLLLLIKRQGGIRRIFARVEKDYFELRYHVILSRLFFIPIVLIALSGVFLSADNFSLLPSNTIEHKVMASVPPQDIIPTKKDIFESTTLDAVTKVSFPFSNDEEDYFQIDLKNSELLVNQHTNAIVSEVPYPFVQVATQLSYLLHTGEGSILWSLVLLLSSFALLFFIYSGFKMTFKQRVKLPKPSLSYSKDEAEFIILFGSETGSTFKFAKMLLNAFFLAGKKAMITELNDFSTYQNAKHLIVLTATYGNGDAPSNATKFEELFQEVEPLKTLNYSVVGFGDLEYPEFCQFAVDVDALLSQHPKYNGMLELTRIDNGTTASFQDWVDQWNLGVGETIGFQLPKIEAKAIKKQPLKVVLRTALNDDASFLVHFKKPRKLKIQSGDLLAIVPKEGEKERLYSVGKVGKEIILSIKKQQYGICSTFLSELQSGTTLRTRLQKNEQFYFPSDSKSVIFISNGTGIAPFIGMIDENVKQLETHLFWGARNKNSLELYQPFITAAQSKDQLSAFYPIYSREATNPGYVQNRVAQKAALIAKTLEEGGTIMICGALRMQEDVLIELENISKNKLGKALKTFESQIKMDCY